MIPLGFAKPIYESSRYGATLKCGPQKNIFASKCNPTFLHPTIAPFYLAIGSRFYILFHGHSTANDLFSLRLLDSVYLPVEALGLPRWIDEVASEFQCVSTAR